MKCRLLLLTLLVAASAHAQEGFLNSMDVRQISSYVRIDFTIAAGPSYCQGISIERSSDGITFQEIGFIPGICGGSEYEEAYFFEDKAPLFHQHSWYRLNFGGIGRSESVSLIVIDVRNGMRIFPNPSAEIINIHYPPLENGLPELRLFTIQGEELNVHTQTGNQSFELDVRELSAGVYMAVISVNGLVIFSDRFSVAE